MINISKRCMDFLRSFVRGTDDVLNNPLVDPTKAAEAVADSMVKMTQYQDIRQSIGSVIRNNYLFNLATATKNFLGNMGNTIAIPLARLASGRPREAADIFVGYAKAFNKVFPRFIGGFRNVDIEMDTLHTKKFDIARGILKTDPSESVDKYINKPVNAFLTFPQNFQRGVDEGFATMFEHAQYEVMKNRIARTVNDVEGVKKFLERKGVSPEKFLSDLDDAVRKADDTDPLWKTLRTIDPEIATEIEDFSRYGTFRSKLGSSMIDQAAKSVSDFVNKNPEFSPILPFIITPTNIAKYGAGYVPGLGFLRMRQGFKDIRELNNKIAVLTDKLAQAKTPVAAKKLTDRISKLEGEVNFKKDLNRDIVGHQIMGAGLIMTAYSLVQNQQLTGAYPSDPARRNAMQSAGIPEYSIKIGDKWLSYAGIEPLQTILGLTANSFDAIQQAKLQGKDAMSIGVDIGNTIRAAFIDKTFTQQLSDMMMALQEPETFLPKLAISYTNPLLPSFMYQIARAQDRVQREIKDPEFLNWAFNNIKQRIPGLRETLPARYNLLGEQASAGSLGSITTGVKVEPAEQTEVQKVLSNPNLKILPPSRNLYGVELNGAQYSEMSRVMGQYTNQILSAVVGSEGFKALPSFTQAYIVSGLVSQIRSDVRLGMISRLGLSQEQKNDMIRKELLKRGVNPYEVGIEID